MNGQWRVRGQLVDVVLYIQGGDGRQNDPHAGRLLRTFLREAQHGGRREVERALVEVYRALYGSMPADWESARHDVGHRAPLFDRLAKQLESAVQHGVLQVRDGRARSVVVPLDVEEEVVLGPEAVPTGWIEIVLVDPQGNPVPDEPYALVTSDGRTRSGTLDWRGRAREESIVSGDCKVSFTRLHEWKAA